MPLPTNAGTTQPPAKGATPAGPIKAGVYSYDTAGQYKVNGTPSSLPTVTKLTCQAPSAAKQTCLRDLRDPSTARGDTTTTVFKYASDGVHLAHITFTSNLYGPTESEDFDAPQLPLISRTGGGPGDHYQFTLKKANGAVTMTTTITVVARQHLVIGGQGVDTLEMKWQMKLSGSVSGSRTLTAWVLPSTLLNVREQLASTVYAESGRLEFQDDYTATLKSLKPS
jgi:hypothetical protein